MKDAMPLLAAEDLSVVFSAGERKTNAVKGISFSIREGETLCLVGPSGCGKSVTAAALLGLLPRNGAVNGAVRWNGVNYLGTSQRMWDRIRGTTAALIQQEPMAALDPVRTVGWQVEEVLRAHTRLGRRARRQKALELLAEAGLPDPVRQAERYPHQLSGGMCQRAMVAIAMAGQPKLLIADEPTTALDATIQAQILELLRREQVSRGMALLLITHDMGVAACMGDRVAVMEAGTLVEQGNIRTVFTAPQHALTRELVAAAGSDICKAKSHDRENGEEARL